MQIRDKSNHYLTNVLNNEHIDSYKFEQMTHICVKRQSLLELFHNFNKRDLVLSE